MKGLLVSKIDNIKVFQVGDSVLSIKNKNIESSKIGEVKEKATSNEKTAKKISLKKKGEIKNIDLGVTEQTYSLTIIVEDIGDKIALTEIFTVKKFCKITDKFKGTLDVFVDACTINDSDKNINTTMFEISCVVQDKKSGIAIDYGLSALGNLSEFQKSINEKIDKLQKATNNVSRKFNEAKKGLVFVDKSLNLVSSGVSLILRTKAELKNTVLDVKARQKKLVNLTKSLVSLIDTPKEFKDFLLDIWEDISTDFDEIVPIYKVDIDRDNLSTYEIRELEREQTASEILNLVKASKDIRFILSGNFKNNESFRSVVNSTLDRLNYVGYNEEERFQFITPIIFFANEQKYRDIIEEEVKNPKPLLAIVYEKYESIERYEEIMELNNIEDPSYISGTIKFYT